MRRKGRSPKGRRTAAVIFWHAGADAPRAMLIAHVLAPGPVGGLESVVTTLATGQRRAGHDVRVVAVLDAGARESPFLAALAQGGVPVIPVELPARAYRRERDRLA